MEEKKTPLRVDAETLSKWRQMRNRAEVLKHELAFVLAGLEAQIVAELVGLGANPGDEIDEETGEIRPRRRS